ncbi:hypothetical protein G5B47_03480 [Paenibacillus sp. 7124]|uniref:Helicase XPB/Ssl2 N-terminal domain-containing protein n=1 Tax=Paenibacillus apii TaxID=1850370 RepID=A0A6M1PGK4_9BACL|nr:hypothetical protein [Paenibacillus apii]NGM81468.1 hypothetical protein [Paenibacillus apii]NJJ38047.1 hypothetical protein [Paenibacillus apii]
MNLADMLSFADMNQLTAIAGRYRCECKQNSKQDLIQTLLYTLGSKDFMEAQVREYSQQDLRFLNALLFDERSYLTLEDLLAAARAASFDTPAGQNGGYRDTVARFKNGGWLFNGTSQQSRYLFQVPKDLKERFRDRMAARLKEGVEPGGEPDMYREEGDLAAADLQALLRFVGQDEPELNLEGAMYRRCQQMLMNSLHIPEPLLTKGGWRFGYGRACEHYPPRLALLYDFARHRRWIAEDGQRLRLTSTGAAVLEEAKYESLMQIFSFWLRLYKGAIPNLPSLVYWIGVCADEWVTVKSLEHALGWLIKPFYYDDAGSILEKRILRMMLHLGMLRAGEAASGPVVKMTNWGMEMAQSKQLLL